MSCWKTRHHWNNFRDPVSEFLTNTTPDHYPLLAAIAIAEAIREAGRIPSGSLYAMLIGKIDLEGYGRIVRSLKNAGLIKEVAHELVWIGGSHV